MNANWATAQGGPNGAWNGGSAIPVEQIVGNGINGKNRYDPRNNASIHDAGYNARVAEGMERNAQSQGYGLSSRDRARQRELEAKHDRLQDRGQELSDGEKAELADIEARDPAKQKAKADREAEQARKDAEAAAKEKETKEQKLRDDVAEIVTLMNKLGLK